jgi:hypothetical protein
MEPWKKIPVTQIRPNKEIYANEVCRRWACANPNGNSNAKVGPRPNQWNLPKIQKWLLDNPVDNPIDIDLLKDAVNARREVIIAAQKETSDEEKRLGAGN